MLSTHPLTPFLGGLLLNCLIILCLNLGGPLLGVVGPTLFGLMGESLRLSQLFPELISYTVCVSKKMMWALVFVDVFSVSVNLSPCGRGKSA